MPIQKLKEFLDNEGVKYVAIRHSPAFTAQEIAESAHIPGNELAKTVMIKIDGQSAMAVLPASKRINIARFDEQLGGKGVELSDEAEFEALFPGCETGAMPPFGNLYGLDVYVEPSLAEDEEIVFNAGTHTELLRLPYKDFERLAKPKVLSFAF